MFGKGRAVPRLSQRPPRKQVWRAMMTSKDNAGTNGQGATQTPPVVSPQDWESARQQLLVKEKAHTRARDALAAERRRMPWMEITKTYAFEGPGGKISL